MATKKQIAANRRNAKKSTGPKTPEGKAASSRNATKHGLLSACPVLADEDPKQYEELRRNLQEDLYPESQLETLLVNRIASTQWRLARVPALEAELLDRLRHDPVGQDDGGGQGLGAAWERDAGAYGGALGRLARYETMLERGTSRLLAELRRLQTARRKRDEQVMAAAQAEVNRRYRRSPMDGGPTDDWPEEHPLPNPPLQVGRPSQHVPLHKVEGDRAQREGADSAGRGEVAVARTGRGGVAVPVGRGLPQPRSPEAPA